MYNATLGRFLCFRIETSFFSVICPVSTTGREIILQLQSKKYKIKIKSQIEKY